MTVTNQVSAVLSTGPLAAIPLCGSIYKDHQKVSCSQVTTALRGSKRIWAIISGQTRHLNFSWLMTWLISVHHNTWPHPGTLPRQVIASQKRTILQSPTMSRKHSWDCIARIELYKANSNSTKHYLSIILIDDYLKNNI